MRWIQGLRCEVLNLIAAAGFRMDISAKFQSRYPPPARQIGSLNCSLCQSINILASNFHTHSENLGRPASRSIGGANVNPTRIQTKKNT